MSQVAQESTYAVRFFRYGAAEITRKADNATCFLQGEEASDLQAQVEALGARWADTTPCVPFGSFEEHLDALLDAYEGVLTHH